MRGMPSPPANADAIARHLTGMLYTLERDLDELRRMWPDGSSSHPLRQGIFSAWGGTKRKVVGALHNLQADHERRG